MEESRAAKIKDFLPFEGQHCETTATGSLLKHLGIDLSEPMLFGLGQGLGFIYWDMPKLMDFPFLGGRIRQDELTKNLAKNLNLDLEVKETASLSKAWQNVKEKIDTGIPVALKLDCYYLDYFTNKIHFAAHYVAMYGYDDTYAFLIDAMQQGSAVKTKLTNLALARNEKGPMSSKNLSYTITNKGSVTELKTIIPKAIRENAADFLNPPIKNIGYKGINKTSQMIRKWFDRSKNAKNDLELAASLMEGGGTGGALFRNLYRDFLKESLGIVPSKKLENGYKAYAQIAPLWSRVSSLIDEAGKTLDQKYLDEASDILEDISRQEKEAMEILLTIV